MDTPNDNPLKRFGAAFWGLVIALAFGVAALIVGAIVSAQKDDPISMAMGQERTATKEAIDKAQEAAFKDPAPHYAKVAADLMSAAPAPVEENAQVVPGSKRAQAIADGAATSEVPEVAENPADMPIPDEVMALGQTQYAVCAACHGPTGTGVPNLAPPLANSEWVNGPVSNIIRIQLRGLTGPITVAGVDYNLVAPMAPMAYQTDEQIAAVLTYVRNNFGNKAPLVTPDQVKALRGEVGKPMLTVEDLIDPLADN